MCVSIALSLLLFFQLAYRQRGRLAVFEGRKPKLLKMFLFFLCVFFLINCAFLLL